MIQLFNHLVRVLTLKDVERLLLENNLMMFRKIWRHLSRGFVGNGDHSLGERFGNKVGAWCSLDAMRGKGRELGIVFGVITTMRDQKNMPSPGGIGQLAYVGQQFFRAGH